MERRTFIKATLAGAAGLGLASESASAAAPTLSSETLPTTGAP